jgi:hypothetical protein
MTDQQLEAKFTGLANGILPSDQTRELIDLCWNIEKLPDASRLAQKAAAPADQ